MILKNLFLKNFRSYVKAEFVFSPDITLIVGPNTAGKTNIVEAISFLSFGKSFRTDDDKQAIGLKESLAWIKGEINDKKLEVALSAGRQGISSFKKYLVNGVSKRRVDFAGHLQAVIFSPLDLDILIGSPTKRRGFMDSVLSQTDRDYRLAEALYSKGLRYRNRLLHRVKEKGIRNEKEFEYWDNLLIHNGQIIEKKREELISFLNSAKKEIIDFKIFYDRSTISKARLLQYKDAEVGAGVTLVGPHRDDLIIRINSNRNTNKFESVDVKFFGSRGQQRLAILQLKLLELVFIEQTMGERPILLLDDIFSELDEEHINLVLEMVGGQQTIMTTTHEEFIPKKILRDIEIIDLDRENK